MLLQSSNILYEPLLRVTEALESLVEALPTEVYNVIDNGNLLDSLVNFRCSLQEYFNAPLNDDLPF